MSDDWARSLPYEPLEPALAEVLRAKTPAERGRIACNLWRFSRLVALTAERRRHPELSDEEVRRRVAERMARGTT